MFAALVQNEYFTDMNSRGFGVCLGLFLAFIGIRLLLIVFIKGKILGYPDKMDDNLNLLCYKIMECDKISYLESFRFFTWKYNIDEYDPKIDYRKIYFEGKKCPE